MNSEIKIKISENNPTKTTPGVLRIQTWSKKERTARAIKFGSYCLGGAVIAIFIPLLHFILVPVLLIATPIISLKILSQESVVIGGEGVCPKCNAHLPIARAKFQFPISDLCTHCQTGLKINPIDQPL